MRRLFSWILLICGLGLLFTTSYLYAQDDDEREYIGSRECESCHRDIGRTHEDSPHALALIDVSDDKDPILADFDTGEDIRTVSFGSDDPRPFDEDDIAFVMGRRYIQRFVYEVDR
ncbi:MAG TPA: hypothetical protein VJZ27_12055, partial [Aggregatilineales bacterium]|nr:hypothetical protein [Aggregatilineales bacterium]